MAKAKKCATPRCRKDAKRGQWCYSCEKKRYAAANPVKYAYQVLRQNARRRGKEFDLTLEQFERFCYETEILHGRGRSSTSLHIDRKEDDKGYTYDNIRPLTNAENVKKEWERRRRKVITYDPHYKLGAVVELVYDSITDNDIPF